MGLRNSAFSLLLVALAGCSSVHRQSFTFPSTWPESLAQPGGGVPLVDEAAPAVSVEAFTLDTTPTGIHEPPQGIPTADVLKDLLIQQLRANGVDAAKLPAANPRYGLSCVVSRLGYTVRSGYPKQIEYFTELVCALREIDTNRVLWEQTLEQVFEHKVILNTMTKLPVEPHAHEEMLVQRCILPVWDAMAERVKLSIQETPPGRIADTTGDQI